MSKVLFWGRLGHRSSNSRVAKLCIRVGPVAWNLAADKLYDDKSILLREGDMARKILGKVTWV